MQDNITLLESKIIEFFETIVGKLDLYSNNVKITDYKIELESNESENYGVNGAISRRLSITKDLTVSLSLSTGIKASYVFKIPIPVNNLFVINGNVRLNLNYLTNNEVVKVTSNMLIIDKTCFIRLYPSQKGGGAIEQPGIFVREYNVDHWDSIQVDEVSLDDKDPLVAKKLKALFELPELPKVIDQNLFETIKANYRLELRDNICNKEFVTTSGMFIRHLKDGTYEMLSKLRPMFYKTGTFADNVVQAFINKFFNLRSITSVGIQVPNNINPITYNSLRNKIILSKGEDKDIAFSRMDASYTDFIDMIVTPDNKNVNRINELTTAIKITDDGTYIKCFDNKFNETEVLFIDYLTSRVLVSDYVDYSQKKLKDNFNDENIIIKSSGRRIETFDHTFDYIEINPDLRLSKSVQMIPMLNHADSVRASMGARMTGQSIEVLGCERPIVASGHENVDSDLVVYSPMVGKVIAVNKGIVTIQGNEIDDLGNFKTTTLTKPENLESMYGINISFQTRVKIGQVVTKDSIIYSPNSIDENSNFNSGVNCLVAMMNYRGYTYEDGVVISETAARKFAHVSMTDIELVVTPSMRINGVRIPSNDKLTAVDSLCDYEIKLDKISKGINKTKEEFFGEDYFYKQCKLSLPLNVKEAYLVDVKYIVGDTDSESDETIYQVENVLGNTKASVELPVDYDYSKLTVNDFQDEIKNTSYRVKFRLVIINHLEGGDKLTNRYGSKGISAKIVPDNEMPRMEDGTVIDVVMNPAAVVSRKNLSQTMEMYVSRFTEHIKSKCSWMINNGVSLDVVRDLLSKYKFDNYNSLDDPTLIDCIDSPQPWQYVTGCYSKVTVDDLVEWFKEENLEIGVNLIDGKTGRKIRKPVIVGNMYLIKLYHLAGKKAQVTVDKSIKPKFVLGLGKESAAGLKHGTMEMDSLSANNLVAYMNYVDGNDKLKSSWLLGHMVLAGFSLESIDDEGTPKSNPEIE